MYDILLFQHHNLIRQVLSIQNTQILTTSFSPQVRLPNTQLVFPTGTIASLLEKLIRKKALPLTLIYQSNVSLPDYLRSVLPSASVRALVLDIFLRQHSLLPVCYPVQTHGVPRERPRSPVYCVGSLVSGSGQEEQEAHVPFVVGCVVQCTRSLHVKGTMSTILFKQYLQFYVVLCQRVNNSYPSSA